MVVALLVVVVMLMVVLMLISWSDVWKCVGDCVGGWSVAVGCVSGCSVVDVLGEVAGYCVVGGCFDGDFGHVSSCSVIGSLVGVCGCVGNCGGFGAFGSLGCCSDVGCGIFSVWGRCLITWPVLT